MDKKYRLGQIVKFRDFKENELFGRIINYFYNNDDQCWNYHVEEYPEKGEFMWTVPEGFLQSVTLMEM